MCAAYRAIRIAGSGRDRCKEKRISRDSSGLLRQELADGAQFKHSVPIFFACGGFLGADQVLQRDHATAPPEEFFDRVVSNPIEVADTGNRAQHVQGAHIGVQFEVASLELLTWGVEKRKG